jgi:hypothetical protein
MTTARGQQGTSIPIGEETGANTTLNGKIGLQRAAEKCQSTGMAATKKNPAAVALGRLGGLKGGKATAAKLTPEERRASARKAVLVRWAKGRKEDQKV